MLLRFILSLVFVCFIQNNFPAQESGGPPKKDQTIKSKRKLRKADKKKWKEDRAAKRAEEKKIKAYHKRIQAKEVRKRMKRSKGKSQAIRANKREPLIKRLFNKQGKRKTAKQHKERTSKVKQ
jgi:hypothetical protein